MLERLSIQRDVDKEGLVWESSVSKTDFLGKLNVDYGGLWVLLRALDEPYDLTPSFYKDSTNKHSLLVLDSGHGIYSIRVPKEHAGSMVRVQTSDIKGSRLFAPPPIICRIPEDADNILVCVNDEEEQIRVAEAIRYRPGKSPK